MISPNKGRILCVEHNPDSSKLIALIFGLSGYEVVESRSVTDALFLINKQKFDLYILESRFPDGSGIDLCGFIRSKQKSAPVVFYSASAFPINIAAGYKAGADCYLTKPTGWDTLLETVNRLLKANKPDLIKELEFEKVG
jgi:DNA-binding response OmpR family regulator